MIKFLEIDPAVKICYWSNDGGFRPERKNLLFVHGSGGDHSLWVNQYSELQESYNIAAIDLPGHGQSTGKGEQSVEAYVAWIKQFVEKSICKKLNLDSRNNSLLLWVMENKDVLSSMGEF